MTGLRSGSRRISIRTAAALCVAAAVCGVRADLVVVQKVEGGAQSGEMTMRIQGDKARADLSPAISTLIDAATGDAITLMHERKTFLRVTAAAAKELGARLKKNERENGGSGPRPQLVATGKKEKVDGRDTEQFVWEFGEMKLTYWIAKDFPNAPSILAIMKKMQTGAAALASDYLPDPATFPGLPVKTEMAVGGKKSFTTTVVSVTEEPVDAAIFAVPPGYKEVPSPVIPPR